VNNKENFWNVYYFVTNHMRDETVNDNRQTAKWISHDLAPNNEWLFLPRLIFSFTVFEYFASRTGQSVYLHESKMIYVFVLTSQRKHIMSSKKLNYFALEENNLNTLLQTGNGF